MDNERDTQGEEDKKRSVPRRNRSTICQQERQAIDSTQ